jgi:hypothetical protein
VGTSVAHALGYALRIPVIPIHHLEGHLLSPLLADPAPEFPFVALLVSGGHTQLMRVGAIGDYTLLGETLSFGAGKINGEVNIAAVDLNDALLGGFVHKIDGVLIPRSLPLKTIVDIAVSNGFNTQILQLLRVADTR